MTLETIRSIAARDLKRFWADENGATAIEYATVAAGVGATVAATVLALGTSIKTTLYEKLASILP